MELNSLVNEIDRQQIKIAIKAEEEGDEEDVVDEEEVNEHENRQQIKIEIKAEGEGVEEESGQEERHTFGNDDLRTAVREWLIREVENNCERYGQISDWDTLEVTSMKFLFSLQEQFNDDISKCNVDRVENMYELFWEPESFNQDLSGWNVEKCKNMVQIFYGAEKFDKDSVKNWDLSGKNTGSMFKIGETGEKTMEKKRS
ncbi:hypothetical protein TrLO_g4957 [Triparma laevis f. longispina]|uniref:Uncharacterized protein n=1 Tax=Triparma laevis f. longispina TaxID=1714387 RepID=A0A9W7KZK0_9STRA|nr:hypothetical protein TrLO_g4957 [Triparma laevis f. longispina]